MRDVHDDGIDTALPERLAAAADQVLITPVPTAAVLRTARRRRNARRLALGTAALVGGGLVTAALGGLPDADEKRQPTTVLVPPATPSPAGPGVTRPSNAVLGEGAADGYRFRVEVDIWAAAADEDDVWNQIRAMYDSDTEMPFEVENGANHPPVKGEDKLPFTPGKSWFYIYVSVDGNPRDTAVSGRVLTGRNDRMHVSGSNLDGDGNEGADAEERTVELLYGYVPEGVDRAEIAWENGTVSKLELVEAAGSPGRWFTAAGPEGGVDPDELRTYDADGQPAEGHDFNGW